MENSIQIGLKYPCNPFDHDMEQESLLPIRFRSDTDGETSGKGRASDLMLKMVFSASVFLLFCRCAAFWRPSVKRKVCCCRLSWPSRSATSQGATSAELFWCARRAECSSEFANGSQCRACVFHRWSEAYMACGDLLQVSILSRAGRTRAGLGGLPERNCECHRQSAESSEVWWKMCVGDEEDLSQAVRYLIRPTPLFQVVGGSSEAVRAADALHPSWYHHKGQTPFRTYFIFSV